MYDYVTANYIFVGERAGFLVYVNPYLAGP